MIPITDAAQLNKGTKIIRRDSIAFDDGDYSLGIRAAAPVKNGAIGVLVTISFSGTEVRISKPKLIQLVPTLKNCALKISQSLGYKSEY